MSNARNFVSFDLKGTALDSLPGTDHVLVAGNCMFAIVSSTSVNCKFKTNRHIVKKLKINTLRNELFATVSGQYIDVFAVAKTPLLDLKASFCAQARQISDFCWSSFDENMLVSCAECDSVTIWDLRNVRRPCTQLGLSFGANQSKFAPHLNNYLLTTHGSEIRIWDLRHTTHPLSYFSGAPSDPRILCVEWRPVDLRQDTPYSFITSTNDGALKHWNITNHKESGPTIVTIERGHPTNSVWRLVFSDDGDDLATITYPQPLSGSNTVNFFTNSSLNTKSQPLKFNNTDCPDVIIDVTWQKLAHKNSCAKYLYTLSKKGKLTRHPIVHEYLHEIRDEMATPITQTVFDEERDREIINEGFRFSSNSKLESMHSSLSFDEVDSEKTLSGTLARFPTDRGLLPLTNIPTANNTLAAPQSPLQPDPHQKLLFSDWHRFIKAPNVIGGDLITELEALRKHETEGLYTYEINFQRAAIGFTYKHLNRFNRIKFEMRFHREFIKNGLVFVEVHQKDSPLTKETAALFLTLLQRECDEQMKVKNKQTTILYRMLQQLPKIVDSMKIFTATMKIPDVNKTNNCSLSGSANEDAGQFFDVADETTAANLSASNVAALVSSHARVDSVSDGEFSSTQHKQLPSAVTGPISSNPVAYVPSSYDHLVPAPRTCGARFNGTGFLITFGSLNYSTGNGTKRTARATIARSGALDDAKDGTEFAMPSRFSRIRQPRGTRAIMGRIRTTRQSESGQRLAGNNSKIFRSLADYSILAANPSPPTHGFHHQQMQQNQAGSILGLTRHRASLGLCSDQQSLSTKTSDTLVEGVEYSSGDGKQHLSSASDTTVIVSEPIEQQEQQTMEIPPVISSSDGNGTQPVSIESPTSMSYMDRFEQQQKNSPSSRQPFGKANSPSRSIIVGSGGSASGIARHGIHQNVVTMRHRGNSMSSAATYQNFGNTPSSTYLDRVSLPIATMIMPEQNFNSTVSIYDASGLIPISKQLASKYKLLGESAVNLCLNNMKEAEKTNRKDLLVLWRVLEHCIRVRDDGYASPQSFSMQTFSQVFRLPSEKVRDVVNTLSCQEAPWPLHPFGRDLVNSLLEHYARFFDIQTTAIITCILGQHVGRRHLSHSRDHLIRGIGFGFKSIDAVLPNTSFALAQISSTTNRHLNSNVSAQPQFTLHRGNSNLSTELQQSFERSKEFTGTETLTINITDANAMQSSRKSSSITPTFGLHQNYLQQKNPFSFTATTTAPSWPSRVSSDALNTPNVNVVTNPLFQYNTSGIGPSILDGDTLSNSFLIEEECFPEVDASREFFLDPALTNRFEEIRIRYADILYSWRMYRKYAEVLKFCTCGTENDSVGSISSISWCTKCGSMHKHSYKCQNCKRPPITCVVCEEPCRGVVATCTSCSHGGHADHISEWFSRQQLCPAGCGCQCKQ